MIPLILLGWLGLRVMTNEAALTRPKSVSGLAALDDPQASIATGEEGSRPQLSHPIEEERVALQGGEIASAAPPGPLDQAPSAETLRAGRALHINGTPWKGMELNVEDSGAAHTDDEGRFMYKAGDKIRSQDEGWALVASRETSTLGEFVFAPTVRFAGQVVDSSGRPLDHLWAIQTSQVAQAGFEPDDGWKDQGVSLNLCSDGGLFQLKRVPTWQGRSVTFQHSVLGEHAVQVPSSCLLYTSPSPRDQRGSRMPSSA